MAWENASICGRNFIDYRELLVHELISDAGVKHAYVLVRERRVSETEPSVPSRKSMDLRAAL